MEKIRFKETCNRIFSSRIFPAVYPAVCGLLFCAGGLDPQLIGEHRTGNEKLWKRNRDACLTGCYLERQQQLIPFFYGKESKLYSRLFLKGKGLNGSVSTCQVIAVYNALAALEASAGQTGQQQRQQQGQRRELYQGTRAENRADFPDFPALLAHFEGSGILLKGYWGTAPQSAVSFFKKEGYEVRFLDQRAAAKPETVRELAEACEVFLVTAMNDRENIFAQLHTMCITREAGVFLMHNCPDEKRADADLYDLIGGYRKGRGMALCLIGVRRTD